MTSAEFCVYHRAFSLETKLLYQRGGSRVNCRNKKPLQSKSIGSNDSALCILNKHLQDAPVAIRLHDGKLSVPGNTIIDMEA
jgi:hypothetical protein